MRFDSTLSYPHKEFLNPRPPRTKYNPRGLTRPAQHFSAQYHVEYEQWSIEVCGWTAWRTPRFPRSNLAKVHKNWECAWSTQENFRFLLRIEVQQIFSFPFSQLRQFQMPECFYVNCKKTIGLLFWHKNNEQPAPSNDFRNGVQIRFFDQAKYLGVLVNASLNDEDDIQRQVKLLHCAVNKLRGSGVTDR